MPLLDSEIQAGCVAYFDITTLNADTRVSRPRCPTTRPSPFVCFESANDRSAWAPITTQFRKERLFLDPLWRVGGSKQWRTDHLYLNDGACTYVGTNAAFVDSAATETPFMKISRPRLTADGVAAVVAEVRQRRGTMLEK